MRAAAEHLSVRAHPAQPGPVRVPTRRTTRWGSYKSARAHMEDALANGEIMMVPARGVDGEGESEEDRESDAAAAEPRGELALGRDHPEGDAHLIAT